MDNNLTSQIKEYLELSPEKRDIAQGALFLLKLTGNQIMFKNVTLNPKKHAAFVEYELKKHYNLRVAALTHKEVVKMQSQADVILAEHCSFTDEDNTKEFKKGKRQDHDSLPEEIQNLYVENLDITRRMRDIQTRLRILSEDPNTCPDSDRYPYLKELIELDKQLHSNWEKYDHYVVASGSVIIPQSSAEEEAKKVRRINLLAGKYAKNPTEDVKTSIEELFDTLANPSEKLVVKLQELGIIE